MMTLSRYLHAASGGGCRTASGSGIVGQSVAGSGVKLAFVAADLPPAEQMNPALSTALSFDDIPLELFEFEYTRHPEAVRSAFFSSPIVAEAFPSSPTRQSGSPLLSFAVAA